jgi:hypothetical protein
VTNEQWSSLQSEEDVEAVWSALGSLQSSFSISSCSWVGEDLIDALNCLVLNGYGRLELTIGSQTRPVSVVIRCIGVRAFRYSY